MARSSASMFQAQLPPPPKNFANIYEYHLTRFINDKPKNSMVALAIELRAGLRKDIEAIYQDNNEETIKTINDRLHTALQTLCIETQNERNINSQHKSDFCEYLLEARFEYLDLSTSDPQTKLIISQRFGKLMGEQPKTIISSLRNKAKIDVADSKVTSNNANNVSEINPVNFGELLTTLSKYKGQSNRVFNSTGLACANFLELIFKDSQKTDAQKLDALKLVLNDFEPGKHKLSPDHLGPAIIKDLCKFFKITPITINDVCFDAVDPESKHKTHNELEHKITIDLINAAIHREEVRLQREHLMRARPQTVAVPARPSSRTPLAAARR